MSHTAWVVLIFGAPGFIAYLTIALPRLRAALAIACAWAVLCLWWILSIRAHKASPAYAPKGNFDDMDQVWAHNLGLYLVLAVAAKLLLHRFRVPPAAALAVHVVVMAAPWALLLAYHR